MIDLKKFREDNGIRQNFLAQYLGVSKSYLSQVENGRCDFAVQQLSKLLDNDMGWDVSALNISDIPVASQRIGDNSNNNTQVIGVDIAALEDKIKLLEQLLDEKERTIQILLNR